MKLRFFDWLGNDVTEGVVMEGEKLLQTAQIKALAVKIAVEYISNTISKCEIKTYENGEEVKGELYYKLNVSPNPNQNASQLLAKIVEEMIYDDGALVVQDGANLYCADSYSPVENPRKPTVFQNVSIEGESVRKDYKAGDVFHFKLDNRRIMPLIDGLFSDYGKAFASALTHFNATNSEKYKYVLDSTAAGDKQFQEKYESYLKEQLKTFIEGDRGIFPEYKGTRLERFDTGNAASSADLVALRKEYFEIVAQAFRIPLSMMTGNMTNLTEVVRQFLTFAIDPVARMMSRELTRKTCSFEEWQKGSAVKVVTTNLMHTDILDMAGNVEKLVGSAFVNIDELREMAGMDPLNTEFSQGYYLTKNITTTENALNGVEGGETA